MPIATLRRVKSLWLTPEVWRRRLVFWIGGAVVGLTAALFAQAADAVQALFARLSGPAPWVALLLTPAGMALSVWLTLRVFPGAQGSGIPQAIAARHTASAADRVRLVSMRVAVGKVLLTLLGMAVGGSVGREGPTVQVGASLMHRAGEWFGGRYPALLLAGGAAGVAAAFNTPLAGIVFAIEEMGRNFEIRAGALVLAAVAVAGVAAQAIQGEYLYFGQSLVHLHGLADWSLVPLCGIAGGFAGGWFSRVAVGMPRLLVQRSGGWVRRHPVLFGALCGLVVAGLGIATGGLTYGTGYAQARALLEGGEVNVTFGPAKWLATVASFLSTIPGGIFSPSLAVGAGIGADVGLLVPGASIQAAVLLGMAGYFSGVVQAPITAFVIVLEMTGDHAMAAPIMAASLIGTGVARLIGAEAIYHALARNYLPQSAKEP